MGQVVSRLTEHCGGGVTNLFSRTQKRKRSLDSNYEGDECPGKDNCTAAKKKKLLTTTQYIYQALFKEEKNSDVAVMVLDKIWNLHKIYLCQSPYFYSMFNGSWRESCEQFVNIQIEDEQITVEALDAVFGSLYSDEIEVTSKNVVSILAAATHFQMDSIIERCADVMIENINHETAIEYYESACQYGCLNVKKTSFEWLELNLLQVYSKYQKALQQISVVLMTSLVSSPDLFVMQTEFSLYALLRAWIYFRLHPDYDPDSPLQQQLLQQQAAAEANTDGSGGVHIDVVRSYFVNRTDKCSFLATADGQQFIKPFQMLRTQYLSLHNMDLKIVLADNIIPKEWIHGHVLSHWYAILKVDHSPDEGPQNQEPAVFFANCMRCARSLPEPGYQKWRWTGFNFGLDLILILDSRLLRIRRHHRYEHERLLSLQTKRQFMIRVCVASINTQRQPIMKQKSEILSLCLEKNEEETIMTLDTGLEHPLLISVNLLVAPPTVQSFKELVLPPNEVVNLNANVPISDIGANCTQRNFKGTNSIDSVADCDVSATSSSSLSPPPPTTTTVATNTDSSIFARLAPNAATAAFESSGSSSSSSIGSSSSSSSSTASSSASVSSAAASGRSFLIIDAMRYRVIPSSSNDSAR